MKKILFAAIVSTLLNAAFAQQSITISHQGLSPNDTLIVNINEEIAFIYGGGGPHPMTSGHGQQASPVFFPTVTVNAGMPSAVFSLSTPGSYWFHCGTNPGNSNNWGVIIVEDQANLNQFIEGNDVQINFLNGLLTINTSLDAYEIEICNSLGEIVYRSTLSGSDSINLDGRLPGLYFVTVSKGAYRMYKKLLHQ